MNYSFRRFASLLAVLVVLAGVAPGAFAQKPVLTQNVNEPGRTPYLSHVSIGVTNGSVAVGAFDAVPAGHRLVVTHVSASLRVEKPFPFPITLFLGDALSAERYEDKNGMDLPNLQFVPGSSATLSSYAYVSSAPVSYYFEPGVTPQVLISGFQDGGGPTLFRAVLVGYLVAVAAPAE